VNGEDLPFKESIAMGKYEWLFYVALAGLSWGTYVPLIFYGGKELGGNPGSRFMAILCVGVAYFVIAVLFPIAMFVSGQAPRPTMSTTGLVFSGLAGVAGAVGAICVIFATKSAIAAANEGGPDARLFIGPLIFGLAPIINTLVSALWHPKAGEPFHFDVELPGWKLWLGIALVGVGAFLVLFSKEEGEASKKKASLQSSPTAAVATANAVTAPPGVSESPHAR
jgi:drug/metabolite transporter (DMT)-like permease